jgi:hypothetical protein
VTSRSSERAEEVAAALPSAIGIGCDLVAADGAARLFGESTSWVTKARSLGATWSQIGEALNCSRQAAWERFSVQEYRTLRVIFDTPAPHDSASAANPEERLFQPVSMPHRGRSAQHVRRALSRVANRRHRPRAPTPAHAVIKSRAQEGFSGTNVAHRPRRLVHGLTTVAVLQQIPVTRHIRVRRIPRRGSGAEGIEVTSRRQRGPSDRFYEPGRSYATYYVALE